jgi:SAM-dependent methyltransferase
MKPTMATGPLTDVVSSQYERWMYPEPILDLPGWLANNWQWFDPSHASRMFWPDRDSTPNMDILIAGCGTNQAAVFAYTNPEAKVVAIDVSQPSLDHHRYLKDKYALKNLELHRLPIEEVHSLNRDFDLIVSTGVLHHMAEPKTGMKALAACLRPDGVTAIMLYAKYGRIGVEMLQGVFRELGLRQNDPSVLMVKDALATLPQDHPVRSYIAIAPDLQFDAGLVDTFLHGRERSYTVDDCLDLVASAGLVFQGLFLKSAYYPPASSTSAFHASVAALPEQKQWSIMERVNIRNACHFFTACRADRPRSAYAIDFASAEALDYAPSLRYRCGLSGNQLSRYNWSMSLDAVQVTLAEQMDGRRTIREIVAAASQSGVLPQRSQADLEQLGKTLFQSLWQLDFLAMGLKPV